MLSIVSAFIQLIDNLDCVMCSFGSQTPSLPVKIVQILQSVTQVCCMSVLKLFWFQLIVFLPWVFPTSRYHKFSSVSQWHRYNVSQESKVKGHHWEWNWRFSRASFYELVHLWRNYFAHRQGDQDEMAGHQLHIFKHILGESRAL